MAGLGPVLVLAGPGSGKTRVLTYRIAYLMNDLYVRPYNILAVTFTNKAAREMGNRVEALLGYRPLGIWLGTFHAMCARILRREADRMPFDRNFAIFDEDDQKTVMKQVIEDLNLDEKIYRPNSLLSAVSTAKNNLILPEQVGLLSPKPGEKKSRIDIALPRVYPKYDAQLRLNNALDFDDLLLWTWRLFNENPDVKHQYASLFQHVLVDEFQDTNQVQYELLRQLASENQNIFVVGDEDQSIYRWRGADYRNVLRFEEDFPNAEKILLEQNYRSTQTVLDVATAVINKNTNRTPKRLKAMPERGTGGKISIYVAGDDFAEADYVVETIQRLVSRGEAQMSDFAIMYRTNAQSRLFEDAFMRAGLPYRLVGAQRFYGRREIKDLIAYLRLIQNPSDEISLGRVINVPSRKIGAKTIEELERVADTFETRPGLLLMELGLHGDKSVYWQALKGGQGKLAEFGALLAGWHATYQNTSLIDLFDRILDEIGYHDYLVDGSEDGEERWENVQELRKLAFEFEDLGLAAFLENLALVSDQDTIPEETKAPTLLTLHASKGLEFPVVFIVGLDEGLLPHSRALENPADTEELSEERRLFYVGLTRAKNQVYLVRAERRRAYGSQRSSDRLGFQDTIPSQFLNNIPSDLVVLSSPRRNYRERSYDWDSQPEGYGSRRGRGNRSQGETHALRTFHTPPASHAPIVEQRFYPAMRVQHSVWGEGMVIDSRIQDGDETIDVIFESVGLKRLVASLANLEILPSKK